MITEKSFNQKVGNYQNFAEFERLSREAILTIKSMATHKAGLTKEITHRQDAVRSKYVEIAKKKTIPKIKWTRIAVGIAIAVVVLEAYGHVRVAGPLWVYLAEIAGIAAAIYFFRAGYSARRIDRAIEKVNKDPEFNAEMKIAQENDQKETAKSREAHQNAMDQISQGEYDWLCLEWEKVAREIRGSAKYYGIDSLVASQSDTKILEVVLRKMPSDNLATTTYSMLMQNAKRKAISDWRASKQSLDDIDSMLGQIFK